MENPLCNIYTQQYEVMVDWVNGCIADLTDEDFAIELSPGKNSGIWVLGHLVVCDDDFSEYMGIGKITYPDLIEQFGQGSKPMPSASYPEVSELKKYWNRICEKNRGVYKKLKDSELNEPHALVKNIDDDYFKTKNNIIVHWQLHQMYHAGQLAIIKSRVGKSKY